MTFNINKLFEYLMNFNSSTISFELFYLTQYLIKLGKFNQN